MEILSPSTFKNADVQKVMIVLGFISSLLPWYIYSFNGLDTSLALISILSAANSIGLEIAGVLFYLGLTMCALRKTVWIGAGVLCLIVSMMAGWLSAGNIEFFTGTLNAGFGVYIAGVVILFFILVWLVRAREVYDDANAQVPK